MTGHYREAQALMELQRYQEALRSYEAALELEPANPEVQDRIAELHRRIAEGNADTQVQVRYRTEDIAASSVPIDMKRWPYRIINPRQTQYQVLAR